MKLKKKHFKILKFISIIISIFIFLILLSYIKSICQKNPKFSNTNNIHSIHSALLVFSNQKNNFIKKSNSKPNNYIAWKWDGSGFNNTRMAVEIIFGLAIIYNRTLILPPRSSWAHIKNSCKLEDFYDIDGLRNVVPIITSKEWFGKEISYDEYTNYFSENNGLNLNKEEEEKIPALNTLWEDFNSKLHNNNNKFWFLNMRMFSNVNSYFRNSDKLDIINQKIFEGFKFKQEVINITNSCLSKHGFTKIATYNAIHIRRKDFKETRPESFNISKKNYIEKLLKYFDPQFPLLVISDEKDMNQFNFIKEVFPNMFNIQNCLNVHQDNVALIIDTLACTTAKKFIGTSPSTYSNYIQILRGYLSRYYSIIDDEPLFFQDINQDLIKKNDEWKCIKGCWNTIDMNRWKKLKI